ncbi:uncharacterized protein BCR38DRAFT_481018 [Pseudomassariella vexata]|uniref:Uncharacterized protein n=1 Tax=Pseudomassariella vexata TaxID=1141098 RepID=A0A1Y2EGD6_9PEZI|nr:uncharacterized protein BCR38DRAFT_481018 [Pseudomassariella vexata]ORY69855.1 hypothetical protein BCR38DRAFT_481018 [Pseudomassariella vexata]
MDDATHLVSELFTKLDELERKIIEHRQGMAVEFQRYSQHLLQGASEEVSAIVEKAIRDSMPRYPALSPALHLASPLNAADSPESPPPSHSDVDSSNFITDDGSSDRKRRVRVSPPPILPHTSGTPPDTASRSPHAREVEFHGLFTPTYLPLLDGAVHRSQPTIPPQAPAATSIQSQVKQISLSSLARGVSWRPDPVRRPTEDTISSNTSDDSAYGKNRRSALRRSSSSSTTKTQSPRRVRFEVEGGEVLPTASPPLSPRVNTDHLPSPLGNATNLLDESYDSGIVEENEDPDVGLLGSSPPRPKKITSTDRLKALARTSSEDTSKWTVVGDTQGIDDDDDLLVMACANDRTSAAATAAVTDASAQHQSTHTPVRSDFGNPVDEEIPDTPEEAAERAHEAMVEMPQMVSFRGKKKFSPPRLSVDAKARFEGVTSNTQTVRASAQTTSKPVVLSKDQHVEEEEMFSYESDEDETGGSLPKMKYIGESPPKKYIDDEDDGLEGESMDGSASEDMPIALCSTSPAISISQHVSSAPTSVTSPSTAGATAHVDAAKPQSRHFSASIGSYKGKSFNMSSVTNDEIQKRAAKMGDIYSFIGSVDGRSGVDESTSYRPEKTNFGGTPRSLSERMIMEDLAEGRESSPD